MGLFVVTHVLILQIRLAILTGHIDPQAVFHKNLIWTDGVSHLQTVTRLHMLHIDVYTKVGNLVTKPSPPISILQVTSLLVYVSTLSLLAFVYLPSLGPCTCFLSPNDYSFTAFISEPLKVTLLTSMHNIMSIPKYP